MTRLGGWWRLWIAVTAVWILLACIAGWPQRSNQPIDVLAGHQLDNLPAELRVAETQHADECVAGTMATSTTRENGNPFDAFGTEEGAQSTSPSQVTQPYVVATTSCLSRSRFVGFFAMAIGVPFALLAAGLTCRWIYRGFRKHRPA